MYVCVSVCVIMCLSGIIKKKFFVIVMFTSIRNDRISCTYVLCIGYSINAAASISNRLHTV